MITFEAPCCDQPLIIEAPMPDAIRCDDCAVEWVLADHEVPSIDQVRLAA